MHTHAITPQYRHTLIDTKTYTHVYKTVCVCMQPDSHTRPKTIERCFAFTFKTHFCFHSSLPQLVPPPPPFHRPQVWPLNKCVRPT